MIQYLFVYGSLMPDKANSIILDAIGGNWKQATVKGHFRDRGWGSKMGFPGIVLDKNGEDINGFLFSSDSLDRHWKELDDFEGNEYKRVLAQVRTNDGNMHSAYIYILRAE